ncbi:MULTISPECIES: protein translocase subunit SecF [unclassified Pseudodesulfovibrio]|uniref:protein translocase subunit SecF n=1 Tax=unclassified Pseudodesulfovibrio TaxID=2661612 RepID=UPI000FEB9447|nr:MULTISPECIES: protein translocase subunit SecF [unclassified Pseudodesulfovibrio]MCJ2163864.1 protein translocase subunit SecF [Pseudodesulfovibrio sp. S3-i]RWU05890.1 protein translocase subunit SecF [Pseudodesulfovibrio sp. S3]
MGLQIIKPDTKIDFIGLRKIAYLASAIIILIGLGSLVIKGGPKYGIDFAGGMIVQVKIDKDTNIDVVKDAVRGVDLPGLVVQTLGLDGDHEYMIRTSSSNISSEDVRAKVTEALSSNLDGAKFDIQRLEMVGPKVGADLRSKALEALFYAVLLIAVYISGRFEQRWTVAAIMAAALAGGVYGIGLLGLEMGWLIIAALVITVGLCWYLKLNYALGAVVALIHDVIITVGIFSILGKEFDLTIIAALLTIIGYSLNDTIIVFDRIRENTLARRANSSFAAIINMSVNQTLSRTIMTSATTLMVVFCLFVLGGSVIHDFALALLIGVGVGTYSSIFVASPILLGFGPSVLPEKEKVEA